MHYVTEQFIIDTAHEYGFDDVSISLEQDDDDRLMNHWSISVELDGKSDEFELSERGNEMGIRKLHAKLASSYQELEG